MDSCLLLELRQLEKIISLDLGIKYYYLLVWILKSKNVIDDDNNNHNIPFNLILI